MQQKLSRKLCRGAAILGLALWATGAAHGQSSPPPSRVAGILGSAMTAAEAGNVDGALNQVRALHPVAADLIRWRALRASHGTLSEFKDFLNEKRDWPLNITIQRRAEALIATRGPQEIIGFFALHPPITEEGMIAQVFALHAQGQVAQATELAQQLWQDASLNGENELRLLRQFEAALAPHHAARVDMLLWRRETDGALRHLERLPEAPRAVARARIAMQNNEDGVTGFIAAVPDALQNDPGLMHDRFEFRMRAGNFDGAAEIILAQSRDEAGLGNPEDWGRRRILLVRNALSNGDFQRAYDLATPNGLSDGLSFVDLEFLAGFIALTYLDRPEDALRHFTNLRVRSTSPISLGRAGFWEGRAHDALGNPIAAQAAYEFGAEHQTGFYGQLAADHLGMTLDPALIDGPVFPDLSETAFAESDLFAAAMLLREAGQWHDARRFVLALARQVEDDEAALSALADHMLAIREPNFALNIAKIATQNDITLPRASFPITELAQAEFPVPMDLVKAIARRESEFDPAVVSPADARGLMQVLPGTGEMMARLLDVPFDPRDLTRNPVLNARLGAAYLQVLREEFGPSLALVAAGYNAGPGRPRQWIERLGDPRDPSVDILTWVESVPFAETRNYIMRVAESLVIYRARLAGSPQPIAMEQLLRGQ
ncbi:MAG: lytic transglycosylase domain-containing protein [Rhodobacteraceae bacterium]|nr:MAG: lytic transglycosylase domain-containing protein [Paracoccaceae bacterium]